MKKGKKKKTIRITVDLTPDLHQRADRLSETIGKTKAEIFREGLKLIEHMLECKTNGEKIIIVTKDGQEKELVIIQ